MTLNKKSSEVPKAERARLQAQAQHILSCAHDLLAYAEIPLAGNGIITAMPPTACLDMATITVSPALSQDLAEALSGTGKVAVFVACSHSRPGGGWLSGAIAQEESISRSSTWAVQAAQHPTWYQSATDWYGQHGALVIDGLSFFGNDTTETTFVGVAAANKNACSPADWAQHRNTRINMLATAIAGGLREAQVRGCHCAVLCGFGTGVFGWTVADSAEAIRLGAVTAKSSLELHLAAGTDQNAQLFRQALDNPPPPTH